MSMIYGCDNNNIVDCPYKSIDWNAKSVIEYEKFFYEISFNLEGNLDSYFKRIGQGGLGVETKNKLNNISERYSTSDIKIDTGFIKRWNTLVADICGKLSLFERGSFSDSAKVRLEEQVLVRVESFYETLFGNDNSSDSISNNKKVIKNDKNSWIPKDEFEPIEISIHLDDKFKGVKEVFVNNKKANILPTSTMTNLRILIKGNPKTSQRILIVTNSQDTCIIERLIDAYRQDLIPRRLIPDCFNH
ncbi:MAG: hypothetical protein IPN33_03165 [Saprospiraceae bacterium]|nr:hypothetical protein [Saprospiraceae bacterium]